MTEQQPQYQLPEGNRPQSNQKLTSLQKRKKELQQFLAFEDEVENGIDKQHDLNQTETD